MNNIDTTRLSLEDLLKQYPLFSYNEADATGWDIATKTKQIKAKHLSAIIIDEKNVLAKLLLETLEGKEALNKESVICLGEAGDVWQQAPKKFLSKYSVSEILPDGWMVATPKDGNESLVWKVNTIVDGALGFSIKGLYGEDRELNGEKVKLQFGMLGDYILGSKEDPNDRWIVRCSLFDQTYEVKKAIDTKIIKMR